MGMNSETFRDIPMRVADDEVLPERLHRKMHAEMERLAKVGDVIVLTDEEIRMVRSFRSFRIRAKKAGAVFTWQTTPDERPIVPGDEAPLVVDPKEQLLAFQRFAAEHEHEVRQMIEEIMRPYREPVSPG